MITIDKVTYRNLQEQVEANKLDIKALKTTGQTLAAFGIKIVGNVLTYEELPAPEAYIGQYGDAYLLGAAEPYDIAIFTRPYSDQVIPQWVNIGRFPAIGPQGPQGEQGPAGKDGTSINVFYGESAPIIKGVETENDLYIRTREDARGIYIFKYGHWQYVVDLKGEVGPQGPKGDKGPAGDTINIISKLSSTSLLPTDFSSGNIPKNSAYLILGTDDKYHIWVISGNAEDYSTWIWIDGGVFVSETITNHVDSDDIVWDIQNDEIKALLANSVKSDISRSLKTPLSVPVENKLVGVDTNNDQMLLGIGDGLIIENGKLKKADGSSSGLTVDLLWSGNLEVPNNTNGYTDTLKTHLTNENYKYLHIKVKMSAYNNYGTVFPYYNIFMQTKTSSYNPIWVMNYFFGSLDSFYMYLLLISDSGRISTNGAMNMINGTPEYIYENIPIKCFISEVYGIK